MMELQLFSATISVLQSTIKGETFLMYGSFITLVVAVI